MSPSQPSVWRRIVITATHPLALTALAMLAGMIVFEAAQDLVLPGLSRPHSRYATILFSALLAIFAAFFVIRHLRAAWSAAQRSEARLRALTQHSLVSVSILDAAGLIQYESGFLESTLGLSSADFAGHSASGLAHRVHPDDAVRLASAFGELTPAPGASRTVQFRFRHGDGGWRVLEAVGENLLADPAVQGVVVNTRDITAQEAAGADMRALQERLEHLFSASPVVIFSCDPARGYAPTFMSQNVKAMLGYEPERFVGDPDAWPALVHPSDRERFLAGIEPLKEQGHFLQEYRVLHSDGSHVWLREEVRLVRDPETAEPRELIGCRIDITDRRWAEDEAERAKEEADSANRAKTDFLARTSHELRTPLNAILGFAQLLKMSELPPRDADSVDQILEAGRHLLDTVDDVLDIAGAETGRVPLSMEPVQIAALVRDTLDFVRPWAEGRRVSLIWRDHEGWSEGHVFADAPRLKQVLVNLVSNAVKYNRTGGSVTVSCESDFAERVRIIVRDTGLGIAPDQMERMFTPFERLGAERTSVSGTGLGLALSKRLIESMGGSIGAESEQGSGSTFWIKLPRAARPLARQEAPAVPKLSTPFAPTTILHIENDLSNMKLIERALAQRPGTHLIVAMQGRVGVELARTQHPDLILLDLGLPDIKAGEVLEILQADPLTRAIPVVILNADGSARKAERLRSAGACAFLEKPVDARRLLEVIDGELRTASVRKAEEIFS